MSLALLIIPVIVLVNLSVMERCLLVLVTTLALMVELINSAIESVVDRIGLEHHVLSGQAKDIGSATVQFSLPFWGYVWLEILINA